MHTWMNKILLTSGLAECAFVKFDESLMFYKYAIGHIIFTR